MIAPFRAFKKPVLLDEKEHKDLKIKKPLDYSFMQEVEIVPLGFSEILPASMYFPVMFGIQEGEIFPFAVLGVNQKNIFINKDGFWKVDVIPKVAQIYPFGIIKHKEQDKEEWSVIVDVAMSDSEGERIFEENGEETVYFKSIKTELTDLAIDFQKAYEFCQEIYKEGCLKTINFEVTTKYGNMSFKNVLIGNIENLKKIQPEKLYYFNSLGYLPLIYAIYFSVRNFKLFDLIS